MGGVTPCLLRVVLKVCTVLCMYTQVHTMDLDKDDHGVMENGSGTHEELEPDQSQSEPDQSALLKKLEEQNRWAVM